MDEQSMGINIYLLWRHTTYSYQFTKNYAIICRGGKDEKAF